MNINDTNPKISAYVDGSGTVDKAILSTAIQFPVTPPDASVPQVPPPFIIFIWNPVIDVSPVPVVKSVHTSESVLAPSLLTSREALADHSPEDKSPSI